MSKLVVNEAPPAAAPPEDLTSLAGCIGNPADTPATDATTGTTLFARLRAVLNRSLLLVGTALIGVDNVAAKTTLDGKVGNEGDTASAAANSSLFRLVRQALADTAALILDVAATHVHAAGAETQATAAAADALGAHTDTALLLGAGTAGDASLAADAAVEVQDGAPTVLYPNLAAGTTLTAAVGAWTLGALAQLRAAGGANPYRVIGLVIDTPSAGDIFQINLYQGDGDVACGEAGFEIATDAGGYAHIAVDSGRIPAGARLRAAVAAAAGSTTINVRAVTIDLP